MITFINNILQTKSRSFPEVFSGRSSAKLSTEGLTKIKL